MTPPVWLLDVDGVINAATIKPPTYVWPADAWIKTKVLGLTVHVAQPVLDFIREVHELGRVEIRWHTTWQLDAPAFGEVLGLPTFPVADAPEWGDRTVTAQDRDIDIYRVGLLYALHFDLRAFRIGIPGHRFPGRTRRELRRVIRCLRARKWRDAKNSFNGWLAEHAFAGTRCGTGWTRNRALRDLRRHLDQIGTQR